MFILQHVGKSLGQHVPAYLIQHTANPEEFPK